MYSIISLLFSGWSNIVHKDVNKKFIEEISVGNTYASLIIKKIEIKTMRHHLLAKIQKIENVHFLP